MHMQKPRGLNVLRDSLAWESGGVRGGENRWAFPPFVFLQGHHGGLPGNSKEVKAEASPRRDCWERCRTLLSYCSMALTSSWILTVTPGGRCWRGGHRERRDLLKVAQLAGSRARAPDLEKLSPAFFVLLSVNKVFWIRVFIFLLGNASYVKYWM